MTLRYAHLAQEHKAAAVEALVPAEQRPSFATKDAGGSAASEWFSTQCGCNALAQGGALLPQLSASLNGIYCLESKGFAVRVECCRLLVGDHEHRSPVFRVVESV